MAQTNAVEHRLIAHSFSSGPLTNLAPVEATLFSHVVTVPDDAPWMRVTFRRTELGDDSYLRLTSLKDGAVQTLYAAHLQQWKNSSAYFNGDAVRVELVGGPSTSLNVVEIGDLYAGTIPEPFTQCGPTDDRVASFEPERARLLDIGCTAWLFSEDSCFASAGHCVASSFLLDVVEFNVPPSNPNGSLNHPGPEDQYAVDTSDIPFVNGGIGNDWGMFRVFPNSVTGLMPFEAQGAHLTIATTNPAVGSDVNIVGYGVDSGVDNQTQQVSFGPLTTSTTTTLQYQADTEGGNSGSGVVSEVSGEAVAIHTHGGCSTGGGGSNSGTAVTNAGFVAALAGFCPVDGGGGIPCGDLQNFQTRCIAAGPGNSLQMRAVFADSSHDGQPVTFNVDGADHTVNISGRTARFKINGASSGAHTIELADPAGCVPVQTAVCP
jgi:hypothetical protein